MPDQPQPQQSAIDDRSEVTAESVKFGILLNDAYFYSAQLWILESEPLRAAACAAWRDLRIECFRLTKEALKADRLDRIIAEVEEELFKTLRTPCHVDSAEYLRGSLLRLPDDIYYEEAEDLLYKSFLRPVRELCDEMLRRISSDLDAAQCNAILLGTYLCSLVRAERLWLGMYAATSIGAREVSQVEPVSPARAPTPDDFGLNSPRGALAPIDGPVRDGLPTEMINHFPVRIDSLDLELLRPRFEALGLSWELAREELFENWQQILTESDLARYIDALRNVEDCGRTAVAQRENYLGIRFDGMKLYSASGKPVDFGRSVRLIEIAKSLVLAGEQGLSREDLLARRDITDNSVDQNKRALNNLLRQVNLEARFEDGRLVMKRRRMA